LIKSRKKSGEQANNDHKIVHFFSHYLKHTKGEWAGSAFELQVWQKTFLNQLFGTLRPDGLRQYRTSYLEVPRKNGKSTLAAGMALYLLMLDGEAGAEIYSAAADKEQASIVFNQAVQMVEAHPNLAKHLKIYKNKTIVYDAKGSVYRAISSEAYSKHGFSAHGIIFDEVHAQPNRELWDVLTTSTGARRQPLTFAITTAGWDRQSLCWELHEYAKQVNEGIIKDDTFLGKIFTTDKDWKTQEAWQEANPNYGISVKLDYFKRSVVEAEYNPSKENVFRNLHLNQWTQQETRWLNLDRWDACQREFPDLSGRRCFAGLDLSSTLDLTSLVLLFPPLDEDEPYWVLPFVFAPEDAARERERSNRQRLDIWIREGLIITSPGRVLDYQVVIDKVDELAEKYDIAEIAVDRWNINQAVKRLEAIGKEHGREEWLVGFSQNFSAMSAPIKELETMVVGGSRIAHDGNPVLRWMFGNVQVVRDDAGNVKFTKSKSTEKIDAMVALTMALGRAMVAPQQEQCVYDTRGVEFI